MILNSVKIFIDNKKIIIKTGDGSVVYSTDINSFEENSGVTIHNIRFPITGYYINLKDISKTFNCGTFIDNLDIELEKEGKGFLIVVDFDEVEELSEKFLESYTKFLLKTSYKVITINMDISLTNGFGNFIRKNIRIDTE